MSDKDKLKLLITFRKKNHDPIFVKEYTKSFFAEFIDNVILDYEYEYNFEISDERNIDSDSVYKAGLYEIEVSLTLTTQQPYGIFFAKIAKVWCDELSKKELSNLWLQIANPSILENCGEPHHSKVEVKEIAFGTLPSMEHFMQHYHYTSKKRTDSEEHFEKSEYNSEEMGITCSFLHSLKTIRVFIPFGHSQKCPHYLNPIQNKFQFNYESIARVIVNYVSGSEFVEIFFHLHHTPFFYIEKTNTKKKEESGSVSFLASDQEYQYQNWERTLDFGCSCKNFYCSVERIGRCPVFKVVIQKKQKAYYIIERLIQRCPSDTFFYFTRMKTVTRKFETYLKEFEVFPFNDKVFRNFSDQCFINDIKFKIQFAWKTMNSRSLEVKDQIALKYELNSTVPHWEKLKRKLNSYFKLDPFEICELWEITEAITKTFYEISQIVSKNLIFTFKDAMKKLFEHYLSAANDDEVPDGMCIVRRVVLTPSKIICLPPVEHFDSRVMRERKFSRDNFLRVSIQDDNFQKLTYVVQYNSKREAILERVVKKILLNGIVIGPRKYEILAASNSQLREHGLWMYAEDKEGNTAESIRKWMGDFQAIKNVAKYMARMGQCFSTSDEAVQVKLNENEFIEIPDITLKRPDNQGEYVFSDGVGLISRDLAIQVQKAFAKRHYPSIMDEEDMYDSSAFQIRFGGCKGMLAEAPPERLPGRMIAIRPSMEKFPCSSKMLEIVKISAPRAVFLNRPLITILENLGVESKVFMDLQKKMVFDLTDSLIYDEKARKMLENYTSLPFPFKKLSRGGISLAQEPFFRSLLLCIYKSMIGKLKHKTRIAISPKYGRNMLGVIDETKTLKYGQIFAQYSKQVGNVKSETKNLRGTVVVTTNPCMHPGDVRKFEAVRKKDVPGLSHLKDCIVFPAKEKRPHPDEMAGSDLDGDEFAVFWEKSLIFPMDNHEAMDYTPNEGNDLTKEIEVEDMVNFICEYIQHDNIGLMANAHLAWADYNNDGILSEVCMKIAEKYPQALDFAKSGTTQYLESKEKPKFYPDFMEKGSQNNNYKSVKTLGLLYRAIRNLEASVSNINSDVPVITDLRLEIQDWKIFENLAKQRRDQYAKRVKNFLKKYGLKSEAEALTGFLSDVSDCNKNKYDRENITSLSKKYLFDTIKRYRLKFEQDCINENSNHPSRSEKDIKYLMASAWYMVTYQDNATGVLSFPWVVSDLLSEICKQKTENRRGSDSMFIDSYDKFLHSQLRDQLNDVDEIDTCFCMTVLKHGVHDWIKKSSFILTESPTDVFCEKCFNKIIDNFRSSKMCCSSNRNRCVCHQSCSPMKIVLEFFKFYASEIVLNIGNCSNTANECEGFRAFNLQSLALKTYVDIAVVKGLPFLGLVADTSNNDSSGFEEGDPIRILVNKDFEGILNGKVDAIRKILKDLYGVEQVYIDGSSDWRNAYYILIHSMGKAFNRWNLEEFIMDPKCPETIKSKLLAKSSKLN